MATIEERVAILETQYANQQVQLDNLDTLVQQLIATAKKITDLPEITNPATNDLLLIQTEAGVTSKVKYANLMTPGSEIATITVDANIAPTFNFSELTGTAGKTVHIDYDGEASEDVTFPATTTGYTFADTAEHTIIITGDIGEILTLQTPNVGSVLAVDFSKLIKLTSMILYGEALTTIDVSTLVNLEMLDVGSNNLTTIDITGLVKLTTIAIDANALTETAIDNALAVTDAAGLSGAYYFIADAGTNSPPSAAGLVSKASLEGKGWIVAVNS